MSKDQSQEKIAVRITTEEGLELLTANLVRRPNGQYWAFPEIASVDSDPIDAQAIPLDPSLLGEPTTPPNGPRTYLYQGEVDARQVAVRLPPSLARLSRAQKTRTEH